MQVLIRNKKAGFDYESLEEFDAGMELFGHEVKSLRKGRGKLEGAHVIVRGGEAFLVGSSVEPYQAANIDKSYEPTRPRRLLLTKKELDTLLGSEAQKGLTIVPIMVYNGTNNLLKLRLAIAKGKKKVDKRETIKKRDTERDVEREFKRRLK
jgi:SsrA-binding protein